MKSLRRTEVKDMQISLARDGLCMGKLRAGSSLQAWICLSYHFLGI